MTLVIHLPCENSTLSNFSILRGVAILDCESQSSRLNHIISKSTGQFDNLIKSPFLKHVFSLLKTKLEENK